MSQSRTTSGASVTEGMRNIITGALMPLLRSRWTLSRRESASPFAPPRSMARATSGEPQVALTTPKMPTPAGVIASTNLLVLAVITSRSMMTEGAGMVRRASAAAATPARTDVQG